MLSSKLPKIWYGGDYNPDQWPKEIWHEDMRLFRLAHIDVATLPVFSWSLLQPEEERYEFGWLDEILDLLAKNEIYVCLATSTAAHPAWMARRYPDVLRVDFHGRKRKYGVRHNSCPNSPTYRHYSAELAGRLAERYKDHPTLVAWHVSNEYGGYCYCDNCARAFRRWLQRRYGSLEEVNERWNTRFWGHTFYDWDEIVPPNILSEHLSEWDHTRTAFQGISLDYSRFQSDSLLECYLGEYRRIKEHTPDVPVTTNFMGTYKPLDYFKWAPYLDVVSWDNYPSNRSEPWQVAFRHDLMRGLKEGMPFMLMEQTPSQQNWQPQNALKRPGVLRLWSYQAVAHGADTVMYFQLRQSRGACEKFHAAVISHAGHENTRTFREVAELGRELKELGDTLIDSRIEARIAILFDWENWWALEYSSGPSIDLKYIPQVEAYYAACWKQKLAVDIVHPDMDLSGYDVVIAPVLYMAREGFAEKMQQFVEAGGTFVTTFMSGIVDENDLVILGGYPGALRRLLGLWVEEIDALFPDDENQVIIDEVPEELQSLKGTYSARLICDVVHSEGAEVLGVFGRDFYAGMPALTRNRVGKGYAWYVATSPEPALIERLIAQIAAQHGIAPVAEAPAGVEVTRRVKGGRGYTFYLNHNETGVEIDLGEAPRRELLSGRTLSGRVHLEGRGVMIVADA